MEADVEPRAFEALNVYVVVVLGETAIEPGLDTSVPFIETEVASLADHETVEDSGTRIDSGRLRNAEITGEPGTPADPFPREPDNWLALNPVQFV